MAYHDINILIQYTHTHLPPPIRTNVPFCEPCYIYEWMNIVCIVYTPSVMNLHPSSLRAITVVCIFMDGIENIQHFTWMAYLNYALVMSNRNVALQFYMDCTIVQHIIYKWITSTTTTTAAAAAVTFLPWMHCRKYWMVYSEFIHNKMKSANVVISECIFSGKIEWGVIK